METVSTQQIRQKLKEVFGYTLFREEQEAIIKNVLSGKNTFVIMPTGGGKSLCYQIPAILQEGVAIVISPLIALMKDQVDQLQALGINASFLNSTLTQKAANSIKKELLAGHIKLLYIAPEALTKEDKLAFLKQVKISFIAVDEAHCISDWGHDFRPEYRNIKTVVEHLGKIPIIALTATATPRVQLDILKNLDINDATIYQSSFNRKNLYYEIKLKDQQPEKQLIKAVKDQSQTTGIVYCQSRKQVEDIAALLTINGIKAAPYHAGLEPSTRVKNQDAFLQRQVDVIVATIAFGMGIDKSDVRFVIHYDVPKSLEGYYQETGRAGRDGLESLCLMLYSPEDILKLERLNKGKAGEEREKAKVLLEEVRAYILSGVCRRKQLLIISVRLIQATATIAIIAPTLLEPMQEKTILK
jgi:ATP-dependent DNA helicase RecQ